MSEEEIKKLKAEIKALQEASETNRSNIVLLNSVFSSLNKYLTFLQEDLRSMKKMIETYVFSILDTNKQQLEVLKALAEHIRRENSNVD